MKLRWVRQWLITATVAAVGCSENPSGPTFGSLVVTISGLPTGASAGVTVTGPGSFSRVVTATTTLTPLAAGTYAISVADVTHDGSIYSGSPGTESIGVTAGATVTAPGVSYTLASGSLAVTFSGLPQSTPAPIVVSGPDGYSRTISEPMNITGLKPGTYSIEAREVQLTNGRYSASPGSQQVNVLASLMAAQAHVNYAIASGSMALSIAGLPQGAAGAVTITGPGSYSATFSASTTIDNLTPGTYAVTAANVISGSLFAPTPGSQQVAIPASAEAVAVNVSYVSTGTSLSVQIFGLPANVSGSVTVSGPNGYSQSLTATQVLTGIPAGSYAITASSVSASCNTFGPVPPTQTASVVAGQAASASVTYASGAGGLNLCIDGAYITQSIQSYDNAVPLVAGRNGLLRVFVRANGANSALPAVRVRFYNGATLVNTVMIPSPSASVPTAIDEATLGSSWNAQLPGAFLQPGLHMLVDVDPANAVAEANESDNSLPASGTPAALDVRTVSPMRVRLVPVIQAARGDTGRVDESNKANFILPMQRMYPVATVDADVRAPYTYNGAELQSGGTNWIGLLSEINAVRTAEASDSRMYYGVVRVGYTSGVAGLGYIGVPAALGWDHQPSGTGVMAHELGHNFGRLHAPCGNPTSVDNQFPYGGGAIGVFGYDIFAGVVMSPVLRDLMSYCDPAWISDYTYKAILNFRAANPMTIGARTSTSAASRGLLVWGRIERGRLVLEPAFEVDAPAALPARGGPNRIEGFGTSGEVLFSFAFTGDRVADSPDPDDQTFAFVIPMAQLRGVDLDRLRFSALGRRVEQRGTGGGAIPSAQRTAPGRVRISWNASAARVALVRDTRTGEILSFGRGGAVDLPTASDDLEVTLSDGVRSVRSRIRPR